MVIDRDLQAEVTDIIFREATLLDRREWEDWLETYTEDAVYWVPAWKSEEETTDDPENQLNLIYLKGRGRLEDRVFRIESGDSYASVPLDRTVHVIGTVVVGEPRDDSITATANWVVHTFGKKGASTRGGMYDFDLRRVGGALKIARKKITLIDDRLDGAVDIYHL